MGTEVHSKNLLPGYHSMRNVNEDSNSSSWHLFNALTNSHYYDGFTPRTVTSAYSGHDKDELKHKMLQHEAVFKNQVHELHRLYRRQQDIMEEVKRKEFNKYPISVDASSSSSHMLVQKPYEDANRWQSPNLPLGNGNTASRPFIFGAEISNSPLSSKGNGSKDCEIVECRPSKVRKTLFDLQLPGDEYVDPEEGQHIVYNQNSDILSYPAKENGFATKDGVKSFLDVGGKKDGYTNTASGQHFKRSNGLADLNEPIRGQDVDFLSPSARPERFSNLPFEGKNNGRDKFSACLIEPGNGGGNKNYTSQYFDTSKMGTPSDTMQHLHSKEFRHRGIYSEISSKNQDHSHFNQSAFLFNASNAYPFASTSNKGNSLSSSWIKSADGSTHKLTSFQNHTSFLSSPKSHEGFRDKWHRNDNGFYNGSSSGSKELPARLRSVDFGYRNCNKPDDGTQKIFKGSNFVDLTGTTKVMDLNTVQNLSNEEDNSRKCDPTVLPWLKAKPAICENDDHSVDLAKEKNDSLGTNKKLLGFPIFGNFCALKNDDSSAASTSASIGHRGIDINVTWDDDTEKQIDVKPDVEIMNFKNHFDLNSCVTEDDVKYNVSIHWHGIRQLRTGWADGPAYITQCPIQPGQSYVYNFKITGQRGTLFWHAHILWLRATVHGAIVILPKLGVPYPFPKPHMEQVVILGEWWKSDTEAVINQALKSGLAPNVSDAHTINGHPGRIIGCQKQGGFELSVEKGKSYMLRIINAALNEELFFKIAGHELTVVEVDAVYVKPFKIDTIVIAPGQTTNVIFTSNKKTGKYIMIASPFMDSPIAVDNKTATATIHYTGTHSSSPTTLTTSPPQNATIVANKFIDSLRSLNSKRFPAKVPLKIDHSLYFTVGLGINPCPTCKAGNGSRVVASVNNVTFVMPTTALLQAHYFKKKGVFTTDFPGSPPFAFNYTGPGPTNLATTSGTKLYRLKYNSTVQVVLQDTGIIAAENHPIHLHGFNFFAVGKGIGNYNPKTNPKKFNLVDPVERNTIGVPSGGWVAIRFRADNPGVWFLHCHLEVHTTWGLKMAFLVENGNGPNQSLLPPPKDLPKC